MRVRPWLALEVEQSCHLDNHHDNRLQAQGEEHMDTSQSPERPPLHQVWIGPRVAHCRQGRACHVTGTITSCNCHVYNIYIYI